LTVQEECCALEGLDNVFRGRLPGFDDQLPSLPRQPSVEKTPSETTSKEVRINNTGEGYPIKRSTITVAQMSEERKASIARKIPKIRKRAV
jgi:hypothetical protein